MCQQQQQQQNNDKTSIRSVEIERNENTSIIEFSEWLDPGLGKRRVKMASRFLNWSTNWRVVSFTDIGQPGEKEV